MKTLITLLAMLMLVAGCNSDREAKQASRSPQTAPSLATTQAAPDQAKIDLQQIMTQAHQAYSHSHFNDAIKELQGAIQHEPANQQLWTLYNSALLAEAGNKYLTGVPKNRYRLNLATFYKDKADWAAKYFLLDVREPTEFDKGHLPGAINVPFRQVLQNISLLPQPDDNMTLLVICNSQHRANHVIVILRELGYNNALTLRGGYSAYISWLKKHPNGKNTNKLKKPVGNQPPTTNPQQGETPADDQEEDFSC